jgi:hypothetical protein
MFNGSPDSAIPAIFLRVSTYGAAVGDKQRKFSSGKLFTDRLGLPSEDEAIKIYQQTYGKSFEEQRTNRQ